MTETPTAGPLGSGVPVVGNPAGTELLTFLFADIRGYTRFTQERGDAEATRLVARFLGIMREVIGTRGGTLLEIRGDEALVIFGSARQALRAAVELQVRYGQESDANPDLPLRVGIGIDAGEAVPFEGGYRGEALNLAARLCNLAGPGEVLASEGVVYLGRSAEGISYAERGMVPIKGFADPVRVIRIVNAASPASSEAQQAAGTHKATTSERHESPPPIGGYLGALPSGALVGRDSEWERVMAALETVMQGTGRLVMLSGEPGIGKTRVAQEVMLKARHWGYVVVTGRCYEQEQSVPYYPFLEALATLHAACPPEVRAEIPRRWPQLGRLLPEQIGLIPPPATRGMEQEDQHLLFRAVTGFVEAVAESVPVAFLLDDLHWADDASVKLLLYLTRYTRPKRVLMLGTYRDADIHLEHPLAAALVDVGREGLVDEIGIRRLDRDGTAALVAEVLGGGEDASRDVAETIYHQTDGNAFFAQEMLRGLVESGEIYQKDGRWEHGRIEEMEIPKSVRSLIGRRLTRLDEPAREMLRQASVLGQEFAFEDLLALAALAPPAGPAPERRELLEDEIESALEQAIRSGLVRESGDSYAFNHSLTQAALYADLSTRRRKRLHLAAGGALEGLPEMERAQRAGELAWHFLAADDAERALTYTMLAGDRAEQVFANREAEGHYRTALELARELGTREAEVQALEKLAGVLTLEARYEEALANFELAARQYQTAGDREAEARVVAQIGEIHYLRDTADEGIARLQPMVEALEDAEASCGAAAIWSALARLYVDSGRHREQLAAAERSVEIARTLGDDALLLGAEVARTDALWRLEQHDDALRTMEELIPRAEATRDLYNLARALGYMASYHARRGEMDKDRAYRVRMLEIADRRGDRGQVILASLSLSGNAFIVGDWDSADRYLRQAEDIVQTLGTTRLAIWPLAARGWLSLRRGDRALAADRAHQVLSLTTRASDPSWIRSMHSLLAECDLVEDKPRDALARLAPFLEQPGWKRDVGYLGTLAHVLAELGDVDSAREHAALGVKRAIEQGRQDGLVEALVVEGMVANVQGAFPEAEQLLSDALNHARDIPFPHGEARALVELARCNIAGANHTDAVSHLRDAVTIFGALGAVPDLGIAQELLASVGG